MGRVLVVQGAAWFGFLWRKCVVHVVAGQIRGEVCQAGTTPVQSDISGVKTSHCLSVPEGSISLLSIFYFHLLS